jgi:hypothetical protein
MSSTTSVVAAVGPASSTPRGTTIDVFFNFGGGRRWTHRQRPPGGMPLTSSSTFMVAATAPASSTPQGARHRHLLQTTLVAAAGPTGSTPRGPAIDVLQRVVAVASTFWQQLSGGTMVHTIATVCSTSKTLFMQPILSKPLRC